MQNARTIVSDFYTAVRARDINAARELLDPDLTFYGLFETYRSADEYLRALSGLLSITTDLEITTIVGDGNNAAVFFELTTTAPAAGHTLVAEWHVVRGGRITHVRSAFDGRPFAAMFGAAGTDSDASPSETLEQSERAIRALNDAVASALLSGDARRRAALWTDDGSVVPPQGGFFKGHAALENHFDTESATITPSSKAAFSDYRFRFIRPDVVFVDTRLTLTDVTGPDGQMQPVVPIEIVFTAVRRDGRWFIHDERAHFGSADVA